MIASTSPAERWQVPVLLGLGLWLLFPPACLQPLLDRDEPRFAQATVEMVRRSEWIVPYFNGEFRFDKPPLTYWLMRWTGLRCRSPRPGA